MTKPVTIFVTLVFPTQNNEIEMDLLHLLNFMTKSKNCFFLNSFLLQKKNDQQTCSTFGYV